MFVVEIVLDLYIVPIQKKNMPYAKAVKIMDLENYLESLNAEEKVDVVQKAFALLNG